MRQHATYLRRRPCSGSLLIEVSLALGLAVMLALVMMKASLLAISGNQWTVMQTLTDAYLTRETALSNRIPWVDLTATGSPWPSMDASADQTITLGKAAGGSLIQATLTRFRLASNLHTAVVARTHLCQHGMCTQYQRSSYACCRCSWSVSSCRQVRAHRTQHQYVLSQCHKHQPCLCYRLR